MVVTIDRNSGLFSKQVSDELNKAFYEVNQNIQNYKAEELEYPYNVTAISGSNSFMIEEKILCIREKFVSAGYYPTFTKIMELPKAVPYDVWLSATSESSAVMTIHISNKDVYVYGISAANEVFNIIADIVIP